MSDLVKTYQCWSLQHKDFLNQQNTPLICAASYSEKSWDFAYKLMEDFYNGRMKHPLQHKLIWVWPEGFFIHLDDQYVTLTSLDPNIESLKQMLVLNLEIPEDELLISDYSAWNRLMEYCIINNSYPENLKPWQQRLFLKEFLKETGETQGAVRHIEKRWIVSQEPLRWEILDQFDHIYRP